MTVPVGAGPPAGGTKVAVSVTVVPGATELLLVEAMVFRPMFCRATPNCSAGTPQPTGVVMGA